MIGGIGVKLGAPPCAAAGPSGGAGIDGGLRAQSATDTGVLQTSWSSRAVPRQVVTPLHMGGVRRHNGVADYGA